MRCSTRAGIMLLLLAALVTGVQLGAPAAPIAAQGQDSGITLRVIAALNGHVKYGEWLPLHVQVTNHGGDLDAEVRSIMSGSSQLVTYAAPAPLPAGARKEVVLYVQPPSFAQAMSVQVVSGEQVLVEAEVEIATHPRSAYLIGALASMPDALAALNGLVLTGRDAVHLLPLTLDTFPSRWEALRSLDCLILSGVDTSSLTPDQAAALQMWVMEGGRLVIGGGAGARRTLSGLPAALRPIEPGETVEMVALDSLADFVDQPIQVSGPFPATIPGEIRGRRLLEEAGQPLMVQTALGEGWVIYLALDPAGSPFNAWAGTPAFWRRLLEPGAALEANVPRDIPARFLESEQMGYALTNLPSLELPSIRWLGLLLSFYILLVGPVNYLILRQVRRLDYAWVTIPVLTLLFSAAGYGLGYRLRGNDVIVHQVSIVSLYHDSDDAVARSYIGLFSPTRRDYELQIGTDALIGPLSQNGWGGYGEPTVPLSVLQGNPAVVRSLGINQWAMQSVQTESRLGPMGNGVEADMTIRGDRVLGTLENHLTHPLEDVVVVYGSRFAHVGDVAAGQATEVDVALEESTMGAPFPWSLFQQDPSTNLGVPSRESTLRQAILSAFFHTNWGAPPIPTDPLLLAWTGERPLEVQVSGVRASHQSTTLLVLQMPLDIPEGRVELPFGVLSSRFLDIEGDAGQCGSYGQAYLNDGTVTMEYTLPTNIRGLRLSALQLRVDTDNFNGWTQAPQVALYDWSQNAWVELDSIERGTVQSINNPERFLDDAGGTVRLRAGQTGRQNGMCYQFDVAAEGQVMPYGEENGGE